MLTIDWNIKYGFLMHRNDFAYGNDATLIYKSMLLKYIIVTKRLRRRWYDNIFLVDVNYSPQRTDYTIAANYLQRIIKYEMLWPYLVICK